MAIMRHNIIFGDVNSADYGIYIGGEGVFNAPKRDVELIDIPGRNGSFVLDNGRFENITLTYSAFNYESNLTDFKTNLANFRSAISSKVGYQRLTDSFHEDEYRMAAFIGGLEIEPIDYNTASEFKIVFECKPQRYLMSGETPLSPAGTGITFTNPTLFDAAPLFSIDAGESNSISFNIENSKYVYPNRFNVALSNAETGYIDLSEMAYSKGETFFYYKKALFNYTDEILVTVGSIGFMFIPHNRADVVEITSYNRQSGHTVLSTSTTEITINGITVPVIIFNLSQNVTFTEGGAISYEDIYTVNVKRYEGGLITSVDTAYSVSVKMESVTFTNNVHFYVRASLASDSPTDAFISTADYYSTSIMSAPIIRAFGYSTVPVLSGTIYIDMESGLAYKYDANNDIFSLNKYIQYEDDNNVIRSDLAVFTPGSNNVTFYGGENYQIFPRWWKV